MFGSHWGATNFCGTPLWPHYYYLIVVLSPNKGAYPENSHVLYCRIKLAFLFLTLRMCGDLTGRRLLTSAAPRCDPHYYHLTVVLSPKQGAYPEHWHVLYCHVIPFLFLTFYMFGSHCRQTFNFCGTGTPLLLFNYCLFAWKGGLPRKSAHIVQPY